MPEPSKSRTTDLYQQRRLLESLGFGFVEVPFDGPAPDSGRAAPAGRGGAAPAPRPAPPAAPPTRQPAAPARPPAAVALKADGSADLATLAAAITGCRRCPLELTRRHALPGGGDPKAKLMLVLESPSAEEDRAGQLVVGEMGTLLDNILKAMGHTRDTVFIAHAVRCCPPQARPARPEELAACTPYLVREIQLVRPRVILSFGIEGLQALLPGVPGGIAALRGRWHDYQGIPMMTTFSLSYMHRFKEQKRKVWEDLQEVMKKL